MSTEKKLKVRRPEPEIIAEDTTANLAPNVGLTDNDGKTKVEMMARMVGMAASADQAWVSKWFTAMMSDTAKFSSKGIEGADANKASIDLKAGSMRLAPMPMTKLKEDVSSLFEGEELTEEAKERFTTLFESAINLRVGEEVIRLTEEFEEALTEEVETFVAEEKKILAQYVDHVAESWMEENNVAVTDALRLEIAEDFMASVKDAFVAANIVISEEKFDALSEVTARVEELEAVTEALADENLQLRAARDESVKEVSFSKISEGLTLVDREKFKGLVESVEADSVEDFEKKAKIIREKHFVVAKPAAKDVLSLNETKLTTPPSDEAADPSIAALANRMTRQGW